MRIEPAFDKSQVAKMLADTYNIAAVDFTFLPTGWVSVCYRVTCEDETSAFLKLQPLGGAGVAAASSPAFYLSLTRRLHQSTWLPHIAYPLPTRSGQLWMSWAGWRVIVHNYIEGKVVGFDGMTDVVLVQLAGLVGRLHRSLPSLDLQVRFFDHLEIAFQAQLVSVLAALPSVGAGHTPGQQGLRDALLPQREVVLRSLRSLQAIRDRVKAAGFPAVICHTDLHGENLMLDEAGQLHIVDWENAVLAPREHDLFTFAGDPRFQEVFFPAYQAEAGPVTLDSELLAFYGLRRTLEDLVDWVLRLVGGEQSAAQDAADLQQLQETLTDLALTAG